MPPRRFLDERSAQRLLSSRHISCSQQSDCMDEQNARVAWIAGDQIARLPTRGLVGSWYRCRWSKHRAQFVDCITAPHEYAGYDKSGQTRERDGGRNTTQSRPRFARPPEPNDHQSDRDTAERAAEMRRIVDLCS